MAEQWEKYSQHTWENGQVITAEKINAIQQELKRISDAVINAMSNTIVENNGNYSSEPEDILNRKINNMFQITTNLAAADSEYNKFWVQNGETESIELPTPQDLIRMQGISGYTDITYIENAYIQTNGKNAVNIDSPTLYVGYKCAVVQVNPGDTFTVLGHGGNGGRLWAWLDSNRIVLRQSNTANPVNGLDRSSENADGPVQLIAPSGAAYLVLNTTFSTDNNPISYRGFSPDKRLSVQQRSICNHNQALWREAKKNPFTFKTFNIPMISFVFDDLRDDLDLVASIFAEYGFPLCVAAIPERLNQTAAGLAEEKFGFTPHMSMVQVLNKIVANGGEIFTHGIYPITDTNQQDENFMRQHFIESKQALEAAGYNIRGFIRVGASGNITPAKPSKIIEQWLIGSYDYSNMGNNAIDNGYHMADNFSVNRQLISASNNVTVATIKSAIDDAVIHPTWLVYGGHQIKAIGNSEPDVTEANLREILAYCAEKHINVVNWAYVFDNYGSSQLGSKLDAKITIDNTTLMIK